MINENPTLLNLPKLILASGSPRRSEILQSVGWEFEKIVPDIDESLLNNESPHAYVARLAEEKARAIAKEQEGRMVLGADTTVVVDNQIIGKPKDLDDAAEMLRMLSGRIHHVLTGVALVLGERAEVEVESTKVVFAPINESEIDFLVRLGSPLDKAGAYAVQAQAALFIEHINGVYWNIVGLPINLVYKLSRRFI